jgi:hypothetical protein
MPNLGILQDVLERPNATFDKRFMQKHYSYRDSVVVAATPTILAPGAYTFGTRARALSIYNWPMVGDWLDARNTYAREVFVHATQDTYVQFISYNPRYHILLNQLLTPAQIAVLGVPQYLTEIAQFIPANGAITWSPTYGVSMNYWLDTVAGRLIVLIEGNSEGVE